jgi:hypothetical protein
MSQETLRDLIVKEGENGNLIISMNGTLVTVPLDSFINQSADGILYDLNRLPEVVTSFLDDPKWINDYAVALVIAKLKRKISDLEISPSTLQKTLNDYESTFFCKKVPKNNFPEIKHDTDGKIWYEDNGKIIWVTEVPHACQEAVAIAFNQTIRAVEKRMLTKELDKVPCKAYTLDSWCRFDEDSMCGANPCMFPKNTRNMPDKVS